MEFVRIINGSPQPMPLRTLIRAIQRETGKSLPDLAKVDKAARDARLAQYSVYEVAATEPPEYDPATQRLIKSYADTGANGWTVVWTVTDIPEQEREDATQAILQELIEDQEVLAALARALSKAIVAVKDMQNTPTEQQVFSAVRQEVLRILRSRRGLS